MLVISFLSIVNGGPAAEDAPGPPAIIEFPMNVVAEEGQRIVLSSRVSSSTPVEYKWFYEGKPIVEDYAHEISPDSGALVMPSIELHHKGRYTLEVHNEAGRASKNVVLDVFQGISEIQAPLEATQSEFDDVGPIPILEFGDYVAQGHTNSNKKFISEFKVSITGWV